MINIRPRRRPGAPNPNALRVTRAGYSSPNVFEFETRFPRVITTGENQAQDVATITRLAERAADQVQAFVRAFLQRQPWYINAMITVEIDHAGDVQLLQAPVQDPLLLLSQVAANFNRIPVRMRQPTLGFRRAFYGAPSFREYFRPAFMNVILAFLQSERPFNWGEVTLTVRMDNNPRTRRRRARGRLPKHIRETIEKTSDMKGLYRYKTYDGLCGFQAISYALVSNPDLQQYWSGAADLLDPHFTAIASRNAQRRLDALRCQARFIRLAEDMKQYIGETRDSWIVGGTGSTAELLVAKQPFIQIVIFNQMTKQLMERQTGEHFPPDNADPSDYTIYLSYTLGHLQLIRTVRAYFGKSPRTALDFCAMCLRFVHIEDHLCQGQPWQCDRCKLVFAREVHYRSHVQQDRNVECGTCNQLFYSEECKMCHRCDQRRAYKLCQNCSKFVLNGQWATHVCGMYTCYSCKKRVRYGHQCFIQPLKKPDPQPPEVHGKHYYAYDVESMLEPIDDGWVKHTVNLVVVRRCFSDEQHIFETLDQFCRWMETLDEPSVMFAHNMKGYDGRLVFEHLFNTGRVCHDIMWRGSKIMRMKYGHITFMDTLLHLASSLAGLPNMLGLDEKQFKKGFFPYLLNAPDTEDYRGPMPDPEWFEPEMMSSERKAEFDTWYSAEKARLERDGEEYNLKKEMKEYCVSDVKILQKSIEAYMIKQMEHYPLNPWECTTIASYAMRLYRTYFMPLNSIPVLSQKLIDEITPAMQGGRTDARRLLHEWTDDEIACGIYGKYQDVQSLYPTVQFKMPLPGAPIESRYFSETDPVPTPEELKRHFGFFCIDYHCTRYLHHPVILTKDETSGLLVGDLLPKTKVVVGSPQLRQALDRGYEVTRVYYWHTFEERTDLFKDYMRFFLKLKLEASGKPKWCDTPEKLQEFLDYHRDELGIELTAERLQKNPAAKTCAKLGCNSLWGKFAEQMVPYVWTVMMKDDVQDQSMVLENRWVNAEIDIVFRKETEDGSLAGIVYRENAFDPAKSMTVKHNRVHTNIALAAMVTCWARAYLLEEMEKLGDRVHYCDTDSIIYEHDPDKYNIPEGRYLGEWEVEMDGKPMTKWVSTGPKVYSNVHTDGLAGCKAKGITLNYMNRQMINFETLKQLVKKNRQIITAENLYFKYDRQAGQIVSQVVPKLLKLTYNKGWIDPVTYKVYPHGWQQFGADHPQELVEQERRLLESLDDSSFQSPE